MECLCPKCGFIWEHDGLPITDELKEAVRLHLEGKFDSVVGAMIASPRFQDRMRNAQAMCDKADLKRFDGGRLYTGMIAKGMIFVWGPFNPLASELVIIEDTRGSIEEGIEIAVRGVRDPRIFWNFEQLVREQIVITPLKIFPGSV